MLKFPAPILPTVSVHEEVGSQKLYVLLVTFDGVAYRLSFNPDNYFRQKTIHNIFDWYELL